MRRDHARNKAAVAADPDMTPAQKQFQVKISTDRDNAFRENNNRHRFWRYCDKKPCMRARSCRGDPYACLDRHRHRISPAAKAYKQFFLEAMAGGGVSRDEAMRIADARFDKWQEHMAQVLRTLAAHGLGPLDDFGPPPEQQGDAAPNGPGMRTP